MTATGENSHHDEERYQEGLGIGDLTYHEEFLKRDQVPAVGDKTALPASFAKARAFKQRIPDLVILPAHDASAEQKLRRAA